MFLRSRNVEVEASDGRIIAMFLKGEYNKNQPEQFSIFLRCHRSPHRNIYSQGTLQRGSTEDLLWEADAGIVNAFTCRQWYVDVHCFASWTNLSLNMGR